MKISRPGNAWKFVKWPRREFFCDLAHCEVVEATHAKFDMYWQRYKVNDVERQSHGDNLLTFVRDFNSKNM